MGLWVDWLRLVGRFFPNRSILFIRVRQSSVNVREVFFKFLQKTNYFFFAYPFFIFFIGLSVAFNLTVIFAQ